MTIASNYRQALRLLRDFTKGSYDIYALAGSSNVRKRVEVMSAIQGFQTPQSKAGVNAIRATLYDLAGIDGAAGTLAAQERVFVEWAKGNVDE